MKARFLYITLALAILNSSCSTYKASIKKHENLQYEAIRVYPEWKYEEPKGKKWITPVIGIGAGALYGYTNETTFNEETYSGAESAGLWAAGGLLAGLIVNGVLFPKRNRAKTRFDISQTEKWIADYNRTTNSNYMVKEKGVKNTLTLVPQDKVERLRREYKLMFAKLNKTNPSITFNELQDWKYHLKGKYSILPESELNTISNVISRNEQKVADGELLSKANELRILSNDYGTIQTVLKFKEHNQKLYYAASSTVQQNVNKVAAGKLNELLNNVLQNEQIALNQIKTTLSDGKQFDTFYQKFDSRFRMLKNNAQVQRFYRTIIEKKTAVISQYADQIRARIKGTTSLLQLSEIEGQYFSNLDSKNYAVKNLSYEITSRRKEILAEEKQREIAEANKIKRERESRRRMLNSLPQEIQGSYLSELDFTTDGLRNKSILGHIYRGDFEKIPYDRENTKFSILFDAYINAYATYCASSLPADKIELTRQECATERVTRNGWGIETGRQCISWVSVGTGLYASPKMHRAKAELDRQQAADMLSKFWKILLDKDKLGTISSMARDAQLMKADMTSLIKMNGCSSPGLRRFEENLRLFALNKQAIRLGGENLSESSTAVFSKNHDYQKLTEDLIYAQSKKWSVNRYQRGSANDLRVVSEDQLGRPSELNVKYHYLNFSGRISRGSVRITFSEGLPECLYFFDFPHNCKGADRRVIANYANGQYLK